MTQEELQAQISQYTNELEETNRQITKKEQECADEYKKIEESIPITPSGTTVPKGSSYSYTIKNPSGKTIKPQNSYQDGTTLEYNGVTCYYTEIPKAQFDLKIGIANDEEAPTSRETAT